MPSLRHPDITLRDTLALKLLVMRWGADLHDPGKLDMAREWVDDLAEYARGDEL